MGRLLLTVPRSRATPRWLFAHVVLVCIGLTGCSAAAEDSSSARPATEETISDGRSIDVTGSTLARNEEGVESALACAKVEAGFLIASEGSAGDARAQLEEGAALAAETGISTYTEPAAALAASLDASAANTVSAEALAAADALLEQCAADGFERLS